jgi:DNA-directed RNA polymerase subunit RPC12/RpoP
MHAETQLLVCLRCERSFQELDPDNPPLQCPNCGREAYWAVQTPTARVVYVPGMPVAPAGEAPSI